MFSTTSKKFKSAFKTKQSRAHKIKDTCLSVLWVVLLAILFRSFCYEPFHISSGSMEDSLLVGDFIVASKYSYGYSKYSLPFNLPIIPKRIFYRLPQRGDIALFRPPQDPYKHYIKRVIGLPGDKVQFRQGVLYLNGIKVERELLNSYYNGNILFSEYKESLPNGKSYNILETNKDDAALNTPVYKVPKNCFFMIGDNRNASKDSRFLNEVGYISSENLVGKATLVLLSIDKNHAPFIRVSRIFKVLS